MARVFWDSNLFIYLFEHNPEWSPKVVDFRKKMIDRGDALLTSYLTMGEVLTKPRELGNARLEKSYELFFRQGPVQLIPFEWDASKRYAEIRSRIRVRPADGIQLACAASVQTDLFVSNDIRLAGLSVPGITFTTSLERIPY